jgi:tetratricopeptide (TPR) repeat protein
MDAHDLTRIGSDLTADEAESLEQHVEQHPGDVESRTKLLGYYFRAAHRDQSAREAKRQHVLWLINNSPESEVLSLPYGSLDAHLDPEAYSQGKKVWGDQLKQQPGNLKLLGNSARYLLHNDRDLAIQSLEKARSLDPTNPKWPADLGQIYSLEMIGATEKVKTELAGKALEQLEIAYDLSSDDGRDALLKSLAQSALASGDTVKARTYAEQMLSQNVGGWNHGNNVHHGNLVLGRMALSTGNIDEAKERLIAAGKTPGSPQLDSFGPRMRLAEELLQKHEKEIVLEYFDLCSKFWTLGESRLAEWSAIVEDGGIPDFGGNLHY